MARSISRGSGSETHESDAASFHELAAGFRKT
jgi:hypothetical protein